MMSTFVENHTSTWGNTARMLRTTPATTGRGSWYSWTHWPNPPHAGHLSDYAGRDAAAEPDHQGGRGLGSGRRGGEREHDLRVHVAVIGRVDLAVDAQRAAGCPLPHAHGRVPAFAKRELTRAAVCKEGLPRGGVHGVACVDRGSEIDQA